MIQVERRVGLFGEKYDSYMVFEQMPYGKIVYDEFPSKKEAIRYGIELGGKK